MIVKSIDLANGLELICDVNPIRSDISILDSASPQTTIGLGSSLYTTYRILKKNPRIKSITEYLKGLLRLESVLDLDNILVRTTDLDNDLNLAILTEDRYIEDIKKVHPNLTIMDHEITSLLRLMEYNNLACDRVLHFNREYLLEILFEDGLLKSIMVRDPGEVSLEGAFLSGFVPVGVDGHILNNPTGDPKYNVAFGGALYFLSDININFLQKERSEESVIILSLFTLILAFLLVLGSFGVRTIYLQKKVAEIDKLSRDEVKKLNITNIVDPTSQAKGVLAKLKDDENKNLLPILDQIGSALSQVSSIVLHDITLTFDEIVLDIDAPNAYLLEDFKKRLPQSYNFVVQESTKDPRGGIKAKVKGKR